VIAPASLRPAPQRLALLLGAVALASLVAAVPLAAFAHQLNFGGLSFFIPVAPFAAVGVVVARRVPGNSIGWIMIALALSLMISTDIGFYAVRAYRVDHHSLPLSRVAVFLAVGWIWMIVLLPLPIALFPDGQLTSRRWQWTLPAYAVVSGALLAGFYWQDITQIGARHLKIDSSGELAGFGSNPTGWARLSIPILFPLYGAFCSAWVIRQALSYRGSSGVQRQQLKWLLSGAVVCFVGVGMGIALNTSDLALRVLSNVGWIAMAALPLGLGIGILKYRLYDIDRLISRTLSYATVSALLAGVFLAIVVLTTDVLPFSSPVGVAASTLAAAALFNPLRKRVQHTVDRRFNRARYDAEAIIEAFSLRLRDAVDLDTVRRELLHAVDRAFEPAHASVWIRSRQ
jgi:hypothetical protein